MDAVRLRIPHGVLRGPSDAYDKLLERCPFRKHQLEPGVGETGLRVFAQRHAGLPQLANPLRPEPREVDEAGERQQRLVRRDVGGRLLAPDVLLARLQGEDIAALARSVYRLTDDPARHPADEVVPRREEAVMRAGEGLVVARALAFADGDPAAVRTRRLEHAQ